MVQAPSTIMATGSDFSCDLTVLSTSTEALPNCLLVQARSTTMATGSDFSCDLKVHATSTEALLNNNVIHGSGS